MKWNFWKLSNGRFLQFFIFGALIMFLLTSVSCNHLQKIENDVADIKANVAIIEDTGTTALDMAKVVADSLGLLSEEDNKKWNDLSARHEKVKKNIKESREEEKKDRENQTDTLGYILALLSALGSWFLAKEFKLLKGAGWLAKIVALLAKNTITKGKRKL